MARHISQMLARLAGRARSFWPSWLERRVTPKPVITWFTQSTEIVTVVVLSTASLLSSWSGYQAALWDGEQAAHYSQANAMRTLAARHANQAGQLKAADLLLFSEWLDAIGAEDKRLQTFYRSRFRPEFDTAVQAWLAAKPFDNSKAPKTPFSMMQYRLAEDYRAAALDDQVNALFEEGDKANAVSDAFTHVTVILASALFFGGMGQAFRTPHVRVALLLMAVVCCAWGVTVAVGLPLDLGAGDPDGALLGEVVANFFSG